jgi:hypothetical protein
MSEQTAARRATNLAYAKRICGMTPQSEFPQYHGDFDYLMVANAAPAPAEGEHNHNWHWSELWRLFDEEWRKFA